jgi:hypothetical protein
VYPDYDWLPWKFDVCPRNYWENINHTRKFMNWAAQQLNVKEMKDWYKVSHNVKVNKEKTYFIQELVKLGGSCLGLKYTSLSQLLREVYPDYEWLQWRFDNRKCPNGLWDNVNSQKKFIEWAASELQIKDINDWYNVSFKVTLFSTLKTDKKGFLCYWRKFSIAV